MLKIFNSYNPITLAWMCVIKFVCLLVYEIQKNMSRKSVTHQTQTLHYFGCFHSHLLASVEAVSYW